jgi:hypothetical protein
VHHGFALLSGTSFQTTTGLAPQVPMPELKAASAVYHFSQRGISRGLGMTITSLENGRWSKITGRVEESHGRSRGALCRG